MCCSCGDDLSPNATCCCCCKIKPCSTVMAIICLILQLIAIVITIYPGFWYGFIILAVAIAIHALFLLGLRKMNPYLVDLVIVYYVIILVALCCVIGWFIYIEIDPSFNMFWYLCTGGYDAYGTIFGNQCNETVRIEVGIFFAPFVVGVLLHIAALRVFVVLRRFIKEKRAEALLNPPSSVTAGQPGIGGGAVPGMTGPPGVPPGLRGGAVSMTGGAPYPPGGYPPGSAYPAGTAYPTGTVFPPGSAAYSNYDMSGGYPPYPTYPPTQPPTNPAQGTSAVTLPGEITIGGVPPSSPYPFIPPVDRSPSPSAPPLTLPQDGPSFSVYPTNYSTQGPVHPHPIVSEPPPAYEQATETSKFAL